MNNEPVAQKLLANSISEIAIEDVDILLSAVITRLKLTAAESASLSTEPQARTAALGVHTSMLECLVALDQIHATLAKELHRRLPG